MEVRHYEKIAVFDLDGTLYIGNSHIEILCTYYNTFLFKSFIFKVIGKISRKIQLYIMNYLYNKIPADFKRGYILPFSSNVVKIFQEKIKDGYYPLILSSAPIELIESAAKVLNVDYHKCDSSKKQDVLLEKYSYDYLFVCTDNKTDLNLLKLADESVITAVEKNRKYFKEKLKEDKYIFLDV